MYRIFFIALILFFALSSCNYKTSNLPKQETLHWLYSDSINAKIWNNAIVPGSIHYSLKSDYFLNYNIYFDHYIEKIKWLSKKTWFFKTIITIEPSTYKNKQIWLVLPGLDTYTKIYINNQPIATTNNFFKKYEFDIKKYLKPGKNEIIVQFYPPISKTKKFFSKLKDNKNISFLSILRKPYFHFNNLISTNYIPIGFSLTPKIIIWQQAYVQNIYFSFSNISSKSATATAQLTIFATDFKTAHLEIKSQYVTHIKKKIKLKPGKNNFSFTFKISNPHLWYPYSKQNPHPHLYKFITSLYIKKTKYSEIALYTGIRKVKVNIEKKQLNIKINDSTIYLKAAQVYPLRVNIDKEKEFYRNFFKKIKKAGFNAIITSDKGWYHNDKFYSICDQEGILVIQTLPFAYKKIPSDDTIINIILDETKQNILQLTKHPSIIAWNINFNPNEIKFSSDNQKQFSTKLFTQILPFFIHSIDSSINIINNLDFRNIINVNNKFVSLPNIKISQAFFEYDKDKKKLDQTFTFFTKPYPSLYYDLKKIVLKNFYNDTITYFYYYSQIKQKQLFESFLKKLNYTNHKHIIVSWFNDITPAISPAFIDYSQIPKAKYYSLKQFLSDFQIYTKNLGNNVEISITSSYDTAQTLIYYKLYDFFGHLLWQKIDQTNLINGFKNQVFDFGIYYKLFSRDSLLLKIEVYNNFELVAEKYHYFVDPDKLLLKNPNLQISYYPIDEGYALEISAQKYLAKDVFITVNTNSIINNNFFDILAGESKIIIIELPTQIKNFPSLINIYSKYDFENNLINKENKKLNIKEKDFQPTN